MQVEEEQKEQARRQTELVLQDVSSSFLETFVTDEIKIVAEAQLMRAREKEDERQHLKLKIKELEDELGKQ